MTAFVGSRVRENAASSIHQQRRETKMKSQLRKFYTALGATCLLGGCTPPDTFQVDVQVTAPEFLTRPGAAIPAVADPCVKPLKVSMSNDEHLKLEHRVRVRANNNGDFVIRPVPWATAPKHQLKLKDFDALVITEDGKGFVVQVEVEGGGHGSVTDHVYDVVMEFNATTGCASKVTLDAQPHLDGDGEDDHGGHVVLN